jgi:hypothetical protein
MHIGLLGKVCCRQIIVKAKIKEPFRAIKSKNAFKVERGGIKM